MLAPFLSNSCADGALLAVLQNLLANAVHANPKTFSRLLSYLQRTRWLDPTSAVGAKKKKTNKRKRERTNKTETDEKG